MRADIVADGIDLQTTDVCIEWLRAKGFLRCVLIDGEGEVGAGGAERGEVKGEYDQVDVGSSAGGHDD